MLQALKEGQATLPVQLAAILGASGGGGIAVSPDGHQVGTGHDDGTARLWDIHSGNLIRTFKGHTDFVTSSVRLVVHWQQSASVEDLLQEFGRAGRDGKPSVSVMFHDGKGRGDTGRLKFMAEMTISNAPGDEHQRVVMLEQRTRNIDQVAGMLRSTSCLRKSIRNYFGDSEGRHKLSLAERILEWVFGTRAPRTHHTACCDSCDAATIKKHGTIAYVTRVMGGERRRLGRK